MKKILHEFLSDIRAGKNIEVYLAILLNAVLAILSLFNRVSTEILWTVLLGTLSWLTLNSLGERKANENQLREIRESISKEVWQSSGLASKSLALGITNIWFERKKIPVDMWNEFTDKARHEVWLSGISEFGYADDEKFHQILSDGTAKGCNYKILLLSLDSPAVKHWDEKKNGKSKLYSATKIFQDLAEQNKGKPGSIELRTYDDVPSVSIVRADDELLVTLYMSTLRGNESPTLQICRMPNSLYSKYSQQFERMWETAKVIASTQNK